MYSDRVGSSLRTLAVVTLVAAVSILVIWLPVNYHRSLGGLVVFVLVFGFASGAYVSLMTPALIEVAGGHTHDLGAKAGTFFAIIAVASLTGLPIQGAIISRAAGGGDGSDLMGLIVFSGVVMLAGTGMLASVAWLSAKEKRTRIEAEE